MKKLWVFLLLILFSCQPDELMVVEPYPQYEMVFEETESSVTDGQEISFEISVEERYWLVITDEETKSVVAKQSFSPTIGINDFVLYTKALPKEKLQLQLLKLSEEIKSTFIVVN